MILLGTIFRDLLVYELTLCEISKVLKDSVCEYPRGLHPPVFESCAHIVQHYLAPACSSTDWRYHSVQLVLGARSTEPSRRSAW